MKNKLPAFGTAVVLTVVVATFVAAGIGTALAHPGDGNQWGGHWGHTWGDGHAWGNGWMGGGWMGLWSLVWLALVVAVPLGLVYLLLIRRDSGGGNGTVGDDATAGDDAMATLRERYARGEIDDEEYEAIRSRLSGEDGLS